MKAIVPALSEWFGNSVHVSINQNVYLQPAEINVEYFVPEPCTLEIGAEVKGGTVGYILQPGDDGYVEGETHGLVFSSEDIMNGDSGWMNWEDALALAANLELNGYDDWALPTKEEALHLNNSFSDTYYYDSNTSFWTSEEDSETQASAVTIQPGFPLGNVYIEFMSKYKIFHSKVRVVRKF